MSGTAYDDLSLACPGPRVPHGKKIHISAWHMFLKQEEITRYAGKRNRAYFL